MVIVLCWRLSSSDEGEVWARFCEGVENFPPLREKGAAEADEVNGCLDTFAEAEVPTWPEG